jgi:CRISPR/Cas system-associated exonuclease Cas4 (RecB family)
MLFDPKRNLEEVKPDPQSGLVKTWSYSALKNYEQCPYRVYLQRVERVEAKSSEAADRGTAIHTEAENYVRGEGPMTSSLRHFQDELTRLQALYAEGKVTLEGEWGFDVDWMAVEWNAKNVWGRMKLDAYVQETDTSARLIDYKTGKKMGNEITHSGQAMLYAVAAFMRHPELEYIEAQFYYLDHAENNVLDKSYTRDRATMFLPKLNERAIKMTTATDFPPKPSKMNCKWCPVKDNCEWVIR